MPPPFTLTLQFQYTIQDSVSVGDIAYALIAVPNSGFNVNQSAATQLGEITAIDRVNNTITVKTNLYSSQIGYFGSFKFKNDSQDFAELFNVTVDAFESSK